MIRMMAAALLLNTNMGVYFFILPYLASGLGAPQAEIGLLTAVHSVCYIATTCLSGLRWNRRMGNLAVKWAAPCAAAIYLASALSPSHWLLYPLVLLHGLCQGGFWPGFWAFHAACGEAGGRGGLPCNSFIWITMTSVAAPVLAGFLYPGAGRLLLLFAAASLLPPALFPPRILAPESVAKAPPDGGPASPWAALSPSEGRLLLCAGLGGICAAGFAEGAFRSIGAFFIQRAGHGAAFWGILLGIRLSAQMAAASAVKRYGPDKLIRPRTAPLIAACEGALCLCFLLLGNAARAVPLGIAMALIGAGAGFLHCTALQISVSASGAGGKNFGGAAECLLGLGIFLGSLLSGLYGTGGKGNPFFPAALLAALVMAPVPVIYGKRAWRNRRT